MAYLSISDSKIFLLLRTISSLLPPKRFFTLLGFCMPFCGRITLSFMDKFSWNIWDRYYSTRNNWSDYGWWRIFYLLFLACDRWCSPLVVSITVPTSFQYSDIKLLQQTLVQVRARSCTNLLQIEFRSIRCRKLEQENDRKKASNWSISDAQLSYASF